MKNITFLVCTHQTFTCDQGRTRIVMLFIGSARNGGLLHGYKRVFDGFEDFLTDYLSVPQGHFLGVFYSSWDAPSTGIPIDAWCWITLYIYEALTSIKCTSNYSKVKKNNNMIYNYITL